MTRMGAVATGLAAVVLTVGVAPAASADEICGSYTVNGNRYWANCTDAGQEVRWHVVMPPSLFNYDCVPAGESQYIGPSATIWDVFATGDTC
ncbi:hypothetical protein [Jiangella muralis]|uniref:hypothetical protein n=1 Tax=Jiangella muralis TaxID=702383 RepID=UPI00146FF4FD|nr:hypothetical protein [Jiangella muralis]